jgi:hypothetical protein
LRYFFWIGGASGQFRRILLERRRTCRRSCANGRLADRAAAQNTLFLGGLTASIAVPLSLVLGMLAAFTATAFSTA